MYRPFPRYHTADSEKLWWPVGNPDALEIETALRIYQKIRRF